MQSVENAWYLDAPLPVLCGEGRTTYGRAIHARLAAAGFDDMPARGVRVLGSIARLGTPLSDVGALLGVSKQAASQLVDTLVLRGYVDRIADPDDRRRVTVGLTDRGREAADEIRTAVEATDAALAERVGEQVVEQLRVGLGALIALGAVHHRHGE